MTNTDAEFKFNGLFDDLSRFLVENRQNEEISNGAYAVEYAKAGMSIFPIIPKGKEPLKDFQLGFSHGFMDATRDPKKIARTWFKHNKAGIAWALPSNVIVIDCDVQKDQNGKPILKDGMPIVTGLESFQKLILDLNLRDDDIKTLSQRTQSGGRQFFYAMPDNLTSSNHTGILGKLDLKGIGGYVLIPPSLGPYGKYEYLNIAPIRAIPEKLLAWIQDRYSNKDSDTLIEPDYQDVTDTQTKELLEELGPVWIKASGKRWKLGKAISGMLYRDGWDLEKTDFVIQRLCDLIPNGKEHRGIAKWVYSKMSNTDYKIEGFTTLRRIIEEVENVK